MFIIIIKKSGNQEERTMGVDASTQIWLGFKVNYRRELISLLGELPEELYDELQEQGEIEMNGLKFRIFKHAYDPVGFGIELLDQGWRDVPTVFDLTALTKKVQEMTPRVVQTLKTVGITNEPNVWLATNL